MRGELIFVVDDDAAVRASLQALLETAGYRTGQFESGLAFLDSVESSSGACVLLDVKMPGWDGLEVQRRLNHRDVPLPVIILTGHGDVAMAVRAMRAGAADFLEKPVSRERMQASIARAIGSRRNDRRDQQERSDIGTRLGALTTRERQVLEQLVMGRTNKAAAHALGIRSCTVGVYRRNVMVKMGADSLSHLVRMTLVAGIDSLGGKALPAPGTR